MYSESEARKTRSLSICLIMVLSALGPVVSASFGTMEEMNSTLYVDGVEYEMVAINYWGDLDCTEVTDNDGNVEGYECEEDIDGDGESDQGFWFDDCDDSSGRLWETSGRLWEAWGRLWEALGGWRRLWEALGSFGL